MFTLIIMYAALAASFTVSKIALKYATPYFLIGFRMILAGLLFLAYQFFFERKNFFIHKKDWFTFIKVTFFYIYVTYIGEFWALQYISSSKDTILYSLTPFVAAILAYFLVAEKLTVHKIIGMVVGTLGMIPILMTQDDLREGAMQLFSISLPEVVLLIAVCAGAYAWFPIKRLMDKGYHLPMINGVTMLLGGIAAMITSFAVEGFSTPHVSDTGQFLLWTIALIILTNVIFYLLYGWHLRFYSFTLISFTGFLSPIFGSFFGWLFLNEKITWNHFASLILISAGLYLFYRDEFGKKKRSAA